MPPSADSQSGSGRTMYSSLHKNPCVLSFLDVSPEWTTAESTKKIMFRQPEMSRKRPQLRYKDNLKRDHTEADINLDIYARFLPIDLDGK